MHLPSAQRQLSLVQQPPLQAHLPLEQQSAFAHAQEAFKQQVSVAAKAYPLNTMADIAMASMRRYFLIVFSL